MSRADIITSKSRLARVGRSAPRLEFWGSERFAQIDAIRKTAIELHEYRSAQRSKKQWGITKLYNEYFNEPASQLAKLHRTLDELVLKAYDFSKTDDLLEKLLALNLELAEKEKNGEAVIGPWAPDKLPEAS